MSGRWRWSVLAALIVLGATGCSDNQPGAVRPSVASASRPSSDVPTTAQISSPVSTSTVNEASRGRFRPTGAPMIARAEALAAPLPDGRVLVVGGCACADAEVYDPAIGTFSATGPVSHVRAQGETLTPLPDGRVLLAGGWSPSGLGVPEAEVYHPASGSFADVGDLIVPVAFHAAITLANGRVLLAGGADDEGDRLVVTQVFDPATNTFFRGQDLPGARAGAATATLEDGALIVGGAGSCTRDDPLPDALRVNDTGLVTSVATLITPRTGATAVGLVGDSVVVVAGSTSCRTEEPIGKAEILASGAAAFASAGETAPMLAAAAVLLDNGSVLVLGDGTPASVLYEMPAGVLVPGPDLTHARFRPAMVGLDDGSILVVGGSDERIAAEIYEP